MGGRSTASDLENGINIAAMGVWLAGEAAIAQARADRQARDEIIAHNAAVARIRAARRRRAAAAAAEEAAAVENGRTRMARWIEIVTTH